MAKKSAFNDMESGDRVQLGIRIRAVCEAIGTMTEAARKAELSVDQLGRIVAGKSAPSLLSVSRLAEAAGYNLEWIVSGHGERRRSAGSVAMDRDQTSALDREVRASVGVLLDVYEAAGFPFAEDDGRYDLFGDAYYMAATCPEAMQLRAATLIVESHRRAIRYIFHRLGRPIPQLPLPRGPDEPK